jgi:hypothetical protein
MNIWVFAILPKISVSSELADGTLRAVDLSAAELSQVTVDLCRSRARATTFASGECCRMLKTDPAHPAFPVSDWRARFLADAGKLPS